MEDILAGVERRAQVTWTLPRSIVARMAVAIIDGLLLGWLSDRDDEAVRTALGAFGSQLAALASPRETPAS